MQQHPVLEKIKAAAKRIKKNCPQELKLSLAHTATARALGFRDWHELHSSLKDGIAPATKQRILSLNIYPGSTGLHNAAQRFAEASGIDVNDVQPLCATFLLPLLEVWRAAWEKHVDEDGKPQTLGEAGCRNEDRHRVTSEVIEAPLVAISLGESNSHTLRSKATRVKVVQKRRYSLPDMT